jgi:hypothetical protein
MLLYLIVVSNCNLEDGLISLIGAFDMSGLFLQVFEIVHVIFQHFPEPFALQFALIPFFLHVLDLLVEILVLLDLILIIFLKLLVDTHLSSNFVLFILGDPVKIAYFPEDLIDIDVVFMDLYLGVIEFVAELRDIGAGDVSFNSRSRDGYLY